MSRNKITTFDTEEEMWTHVRIKHQVSATQSYFRNRPKELKPSPTKEASIFLFIGLDGSTFGIIKTKMAESEVRRLFNKYINKRFDHTKTSFEDPLSIIDYVRIGYPDHLSIQGFMALIRINHLVVERIKPVHDFPVVIEVRA